MDWKLFWITFSTIFLAEIGDKTQLGVLSFSAAEKSPLVIFIAASLALAAATLIGVLAGSVLRQFIHPKALQIGGGIVFVLAGIWMIFKGD